MDLLPSINKIYSMVIQEESNNVSLLSKPTPDVILKKANTLINAYDSRKFPSKSPSGFQKSKKDSRKCTYCSRPVHVVE